MSLPHALGIFGAGIVAGTINTVVGSGTLFTLSLSSADTAGSGQIIVANA